jgi:uncharacterized protein YbbK (DUF523 family)
VVIRVLVSACLLGEEVRYNGAAARVESPVLAQWVAEGRVVRFCPEVAGGLGVPRPAAEIAGGRVITRTGDDVTASFLKGAHAALDAGRAQNARLAILKDGSPSCGSTGIYDGTFSGTQRPGAGVTTVLLERHGIRVFSESQLDEAADYLNTLERG